MLLLLGKRHIVSPCPDESRKKLEVAALRVAPNGHLDRLVGEELCSGKPSPMLLKTPAAAGVSSYIYFFAFATARDSRDFLRDAWFFLITPRFAALSRALKADASPASAVAASFLTMLVRTALTVSFIVFLRRSLITLLICVFLIAAFAVFDIAIYCMLLRLNLACLVHSRNNKNDKRSTETRRVYHKKDLNASAGLCGLPLNPDVQNFGCTSENVISVSYYTKWR